MSHEGKKPCVTTLSYPTTSIKNCWWWLRQLLFLGVGWQNCQSFPTRTLHPWLTSQWQKKNHCHHSRGLTIAFHSTAHSLHCLFTSTHRIYLVVLPQEFHSPHYSDETLMHSLLASIHCLFIHAQAGSCSSSRRDRCLLIILTHMSLPIFTHS